jgi:Uma2 family endonuclease
VVEVLSKNDTWPEIEAKVARYAEAGVGLVWVVDPKTEQIHVYRGAAVAYIYTRDEILSEPSLLPDFRLSVAELFAD